MNIALDATYSIGDHLSGVGVYSREILFGLAQAHASEAFAFCYRPHRLARAMGERLPENARRRVLLDSFPTFRHDIFHALNQRMPGWVPRRSVCTFHDLFVITGDYSTPEFRARFEAQARHAAARADLIIAVSAFTARQVEALLHVEAPRLRVIHHGVRPPRFIRPDEARENMILFTGAIQKRKNVFRLVEAFERLPGSWTLALVGGAGYGASAVFERIRQSPARSRILITGYVSDERLCEFYARARIFAFPSLDEGFGIPVLEAMAWGVPVVTSNRSALPEVAGQAALLVDPEDTEEIAYALTRLAVDADLRCSLARAGKERASQFLWAEAVEKTWAVYREFWGSGV